MMSQTATTMTRDSRSTSLSSTAWSHASKANVWDSSIIQTDINSLSIGTKERHSGRNSVTDDEVDQYAQRVLEEYASSAAGSVDEVTVVDESLGAYVTNRLREWKGTLVSSTEYDITEMPDYLSLCELLQEHCAIAATSVARQAMETVARAVFGNHIPPTTTPSTTAIQSLAESLSRHGLQINMESSSVNPAVNKESTTKIVPGYCATSVDELEIIPQQRLVAESIISPLAANDLIPLDLLEDPMESEQTFLETNLEQQQQQSLSITQTVIPVEPLHHDDSAFPPLNALPPSIASSTISSLGRSLPKSKPSKNMSQKGEKGGSGKSHKGYKADELVTTLFRHHPRSRQSSIDETSNATNSSTSGASPNFQALHLNVSISPLLASHKNSALGNVNAMVPDFDDFMQSRQFLQTTVSDDHRSAEIEDHQEHVMMLIHHCSDVLLSMNPELSIPASFAASDMCQGNVAAAQYVINTAATAPPICRHLLNAGCYRSDCQFSHNIESHTCIFWLKGRCSRQYDNTSGNASACRFLHGFHPSLLQDVPQEYLVMPQKIDDVYSVSEYSVQYGDDQLGSGYSNGYDYFGETSDAGQNEYSDFETSWNQSKVVTRHPSSTFANIASQGYDRSQSYANAALCASTRSTVESVIDIRSLPIVKIPLDLWNPHENRDAAAFHIHDPLERYYFVQNSVNRDDVIDLHFQSLQTFPLVLDALLADGNIRSNTTSGTWIVTGTGHHVGIRTHQKSGATLENAVLQYLVDHYSHTYFIHRGRDRNGQGGAILIVSKGTLR